MIEYAQHAFVHWQSGTQDSGKYNLVSRQEGRADAQRGLDILRLIVQSLADFVSHNLTYAHDVVAEQRTVCLIVAVSEFCKKLVCDGTSCTDIYSVHNYILIMCIKACLKITLQK